MKYIELENAFHAAIERYVTEDNKEEIKQYFEESMVNDMIDEVFED